MEEFELIPLSSAPKWRNALNDIKHDFSHTWENCYAMHLTTGFDTYLFVFKTGDVRIMCPIAERTYNNFIDIVTPYGFSGFIGNHNFPEFQDYWRAFVKQRGYVCGYISLNPVLENHTYLSENEVYKYNTLYFINLTLSLNEIFSKLDRNRKRQVTKSSDYAAQITTNRLVLKAFLLENYHSFFTKKNASEGYLFSMQTLSYLFSLENVYMVGFHLDGKLLAVSVFVHTPYIAQALFHVSLPTGKSHTMQLLWHGIIYLKSIGIPLLNLGGGLKEGDSIAEFKERLGADKLPLKSLRQIYDARIYYLLCKEKNAMPIESDSYFPSYRKP